MNKKEAIYFLDCLAKGFSPMSGEEIEDNSIFNDVQFVRKLYAIKDFISENIDEKKIKRKPFVLKNKIGVVNSPMNMTNFINRINEFNADDHMKKMSNNGVMNWLIENGYIVYVNGQKQISQKGEEAGIFIEHKLTIYGKEYNVITYPENLLNHILDLIEVKKIV